MGTPQDQGKQPRQLDIGLGHVHLAGDHVDRVAVQAPPLTGLGAGYGVIGFPMESLLPQPLRHGPESTLAQGFHALGQAAEGGQALHARYAVQRGQPDVP